MHNQITNMFKPDNFKFLAIIGILVAVTFYYNPVAGAFGGLIFLYLAVSTSLSGKTTATKLNKLFEEISIDIDSAGRSSILNVPVPVTLLDYDGRITWFNSKFVDIIQEKDIIGLPIEEIVPDITAAKIATGEDIGEVKIRDKRFKVFHNMVKVEADTQRTITMIYWVDVTSESLIREMFEDTRPIVALVQFDNYEDVLAETKDEKRPFVTTEVDNKLNMWASRMNGFIKKYSRDKYIIMFERRYLEVNEQKRFSILDEIREIDSGNKIPITLSIGVGASGKTFGELEEAAFSALELALGRGGDQAVVRKKGNFEFYGGKSKAVEKRNRVKARIIAHAFRPLIDESSKVIIMGHKFPDMDAYGSAIGVYRAVMSRGKDVYIVLNEINEQIRSIHEMFSGNETYKFIKGDEALDLIDDDTMLVVVDTHKPSFTICPELLQKATRVVLFDHHRLGTEYIENVELRYLEPYASSTSELVTEILPYMGSRMAVEKIEAEALLAGIIVDTKSFTYKTGVRTFEAASLLRRYGADSMVVKGLFKDDIKTFTAKTNLVSRARIYGANIAISVCEEVIPNIQLIAAQAADDLLNIRGINTSFVIGKNDEGIVFISGRSVGDTNVQLILEKLGGGGHMSIAGAQIEGKTTQEVKEVLKLAIDEYFDENPDLRK